MSPPLAPSWRPRGLSAKGDLVASASWPSVLQAREMLPSILSVPALVSPPVSARQLAAELSQFGLTVLKEPQLDKAQLEQGREPRAAALAVVRGQNQQGETPLHLAASHKTGAKAVALLLDAGVPLTATTADRYEHRRRFVVRDRDASHDT